MTDTFKPRDNVCYALMQPITWLCVSLHRAMREFTISSVQGSDVDVDLVDEWKDGVQYVHPCNGVSLFYPAKAKKEKRMHAMDIFADRPCKKTGDDVDVSNLRLTIVPDEFFQGSTSLVHFSVRAKEFMKLDDFKDDFWNLVKYDCKLKCSAYPYDWNFNAPQGSPRNRILLAALINLGKSNDVKSCTAAICWLLCDWIASTSFFSLRELHNSKPARILSMALDLYKPGTEMGKIFVDNVKLELKQQLPTYEPVLYGVLDPILKTSSDDEVS